MRSKLQYERYGLPSEVIAFNNWLGTLPHRYKVKPKVFEQIEASAVDIVFATLVFLLLFLLMLLILHSISKQQVVVPGNHELSLDPTTWEEAAEYMDQAGDPRQSPQQAIHKCR